MSGFDGYDQWKTASPYDDDLDPIEEGERFLEQHKDYTEGKARHASIEQACDVVRLLLEYIEANV